MKKSKSPKIGVWWDNKPTEISCQNNHCKGFQSKEGKMICNGTYKTKTAGRVRVFLCCYCGKTFSSRRWSFFFRLKTKRDHVAHIFADIADGKAIRRVARERKVKPDTIRHWIDLAKQYPQESESILAFTAVNEDFYEKRVASFFALLNKRKKV